MAVTNPLLHDAATALFRAGVVQFGEFRLKSGLLSPIYVDARRLQSSPFELETVARAMAELVEPVQFDHYAGIPFGGLPLATAMSLLGRTRIGTVTPRPEKGLSDQGCSRGLGRGA